MFTEEELWTIVTMAYNRVDEIESMLERCAGDLREKEILELQNEACSCKRVIFKINNANKEKEDECN